MDTAMDAAMLELSVDKIQDLVTRQQSALETAPVRTQLSRLIVRALRTIADDIHQRRLNADASLRLLTATKIMMRDRRGIDELLTLHTFELFLSVAEAPDAVVGEEALKCVINSVYSRPEFVRDLALPANFAPRLRRLSERAAPAAFHWMVWKALLVSCEASEVVGFLAHDTDTWRRLHSTLHCCLHGAGAAPFPAGLARADLFLDLVKLIAVLVNGLRISTVADPPALLVTLQSLGDVLLDTLRYSPPHISSLDTQLVDIKNKVLEIFLFLPQELLGAFVQQQSEALAAILGHLYTMLVLTRIEKTRLPRDLQPVILACHHLTTTGDPAITRFFKTHIFPSTGGNSTVTEPMAPAPPAFFHKHLTFYLTSLDTTIKRYMGEWLYLLCDQNADEYTKRTGIGNAIGLLRLKGLA